MMTLFNAPGLIVTVAVPRRVGLATLVAVIVNVPAIVPALNVTVAPAAVGFGEKLPLPPLTLQFKFPETGLPLESNIDAVNVVEPFTEVVREAGVTVTELIAPTFTVTVAV